MTREPALAVLDVGKTAARVVGVTQGGEVAFSSRHACRTRSAPPYPHLDVDDTFAALCDGLAEMGRGLALTGVMPVAHGAAAAMIGDGALALPVLDYEAEPPEAVSTIYDDEASDFAETLSPHLPATESRPPARMDGGRPTRPVRRRPASRAVRAVLGLAPVRHGGKRGFLAWLPYRPVESGDPRVLAACQAARLGQTLRADPPGGRGDRHAGKQHRPSPRPAGGAARSLRRARQQRGGLALHRVRRWIGRDPVDGHVVGHVPGWLRRRARSCHRHAGKRGARLHARAQHPLHGRTRSRSDRTCRIATARRRGRARPRSCRWRDGLAWIRDGRRPVSWQAGTHRGSWHAGCRGTCGARRPLCGACRRLVSRPARFAPDGLRHWAVRRRALFGALLAALRPAARILVDTASDGTPLGAALLARGRRGDGSGFSDATASADARIAVHRDAWREVVAQ